MSNTQRHNIPTEEIVKNLENADAGNEFSHFSFDCPNCENYESLYFYNSDSCFTCSHCKSIFKVKLKLKMEKIDDYDLE